MVSLRLAHSDLCSTENKGDSESYINKGVKAALPVDRPWNDGISSTATNTVTTIS
jgi:hypothetical protein